MNESLNFRSAIAVATGRASTVVLILLVVATAMLAGCGGGSSNSSVGTAPEVDDTSPPSTTIGCVNNPQPCSSVTQSGLIGSCLLQTGNCGVDLDDVLGQVGNEVTADSLMWVQAWGARGGGTDKGTGGGAGGYAQTTTTVNDIKSMFDGSGQLYYFLGQSGGGGGDHCGSAGGSATNVTFEDLTQSTTKPPSLASPPTYLVAGGGGGGCGGNGEAFCGTPDCPASGGAGGIATASLGVNGEGTGGGYVSGMGGQQGEGGANHCNECGGGNQTSGLAGFGGRGGWGGSGQSCGGPGNPALFYNSTAGVTLNWNAGAGGNGSSNTSDCDAGGGGGGGGWGGGGGGGHGNTNGSAVPGAGGGSYAIYSTRASSMAPSNVAPAVPCNPNYLGCVQIQFVLTAPASLLPLGLPGPNGPIDCTTTATPWSISTGAYELVWQTDGNFVLYKNGQPVWNSNTVQANNQICFQGDGNLVIYSPTSAVWSSGTDDAHHGGNGGRLLSLWDNGLLQITDPFGAVLWHVGPFN
jgi:hypothetical protein